MMVGTYSKNYNVGLSVTGNVDVLVEEVGHLPIRISQDLPP